MEKTCKIHKKCEPGKNGKPGKQLGNQLRLESGPGFAGYAAWKSETSLEAWPSSEASIHEVSSSVPS